MAVESFGDVYIVIGITHTEIRTKDLFTHFYFDGRKMTTFEGDLGLFCLLKVGQAKFKILIDCNVNICRTIGERSKPDRKLVDKATDSSRNQRFSICR